MNRQDAEDLTAGIGQIAAGAWRSIATYVRMGVPEALGLTTDEWVNGRLGGYVKLAIEDRREAVKELTDEGMSQREIANVLGVTHTTVARDQIGTNMPEPEPVSPKTNGSGTNVPPKETPTERKAREKREREAERAQQRIAFTQNLIEAIRVCDRQIKTAGECASEYDEKYALKMGEQITKKRLENSGAWILALAKKWRD